jgi:phosphonate transport system permease protein
MPGRRHGGPEHGFVVNASQGTIFYRLETNVRQAAVLGMVGAGGIGFELISSMKLFQYRDTAMCILVILGMVLLTDLVWSRIRAMIR